MLPGDFLTTGRSEIGHHGTHAGDFLAPGRTEIGHNIVPSNPQPFLRSPWSDHEGRIT
jgi:hypothetical protein